MSKKRMDVNWKREKGKEDLKPALKRYRRYLEDKGLRPSSIPMYVLGQKLLDENILIYKKSEL